MNHLFAYIPLFPLIGFLLNGLLRNKLSYTATSLIGCGALLASFICSILVYIDVKNGNAGTITLFNFINVGTVHIPFAFQADALSSLFLLIITGVGFLIHVYSTSYMHEETTPHFARYFAYLNLFIFSMLLLVMGANYIIMFIGWEGVGLCSYLLIGYWFKNQNYNAAAKKAFVMNRIGDLAFLIALFWLMQKCGTLTFSELFQTNILANLTSADITGITLLLFVGATGKSAQLPLYTWLPDAMAGPTPVSALIHAATMVTAGIYMIVRSNALYTATGAAITNTVITYIGLATALLAASIAIKQNDIKKVLAYSTVSQLGFMFMALGTGAYVAAVFHVMTHAFFKALLFLGSGSVIHAMGGEQDITKMGGLSKKMKITYATFFIGCLAIAGIPPLSGFFSKDAVLLSAFTHNKVLFALALFAALLTAYYMFRLLFLTFHGSFRGTHEQEHHLHESPTAITVPLIVLALLAIVGGFAGVPEVFAVNQNHIANWLAPVVKEAHHGEISHSTEYALMAISTILVVASIMVAWFLNKKYTTTKENTGLGKVLENKWYVDELYDATVVKSVQNTGGFLNTWIEKLGIDGIVNGAGKIVHAASRQMRLLQNGQIGIYLLLIVIGLLIAVRMGVYRIDFSWLQRIF
jgi:NADH-quinone oxidoreductase subunit L